MNLDQLPYIIAIANTGSLSLAARQTGVSQPALSKYLNKLEQELGLTLFTREKKKLRPTEAGRVYINGACKILSLQEEGLHAIRARTQGEKPQVLRIGVTPPQGVQGAVKLLARFKTQFPDVRLDFFEGYTKELYDAVRKGRVDYAMTTVLPGEKGVSILPIFDEELYLCVPAYHKLAPLAEKDLDHLAEIDLKLFQDTPFVMMTPGITSIGSIAGQLIREAGFEPTVLFSSVNGYMVDEMLREGVGVGFLPRRNVIPSDKVVYFRLKEQPKFTYCTLIREGIDMSLPQRYFTYLLLKTREGDETIQYSWSDTLRALVDEFEMELGWPLLENRRQ